MATVTLKQFEQKFNNGQPIEFKQSNRTKRLVGFIHDVSIVGAKHLTPKEFMSAPQLFVGPATTESGESIFVVTNKSGYSEESFVRG